MHTNQIVSPKSIIFFAALLSLVASAIGQPTPPEKSRGVSRTDLSSIDLGEELEGFRGRTLRQHRTSIDPGGAIALHDHVDRPEIIFVFAGRLTDHQPSGSKEYVAGQAYAVGKNTRHWLENTGAEPAVFIATSVIKKP